MTDEATAREQPRDALFRRLRREARVQRRRRALADLPWAQGVDVEVLAINDGRTDADAAIEVVSGALKGNVGSIEGAVRKGRSPHREILARAQETDADLVVLGTHGLSTLRRLTLGSTANAVAQLSDSSVLVSRAPHSR